MATIDETGYTQKTQNEWYQEEIDFYLGVDPDWNLDPSTPDGLKAAHDSEIFGNLDETQLQAYNSKDPNKARGVDLDVISSITGTFRGDGTFSNAPLTLTGVPGTTITVGSRVGPQDGSSEWTLDSTVSIPGGGSVPATATATTVGATQADIGTITRIIDTVGGWQTVNNTAPATAGTPEESDAQLRLRRNISVGRPGNNQLDSVRGEISNVDGVRRFFVDDNDTDSVDANGVPARNVYAIVDGGIDEDVALAIYVKKNPGPPWYQAGTPVSVNIQSPLYPQQFTDIKFSRPLFEDMNVIVNITNDGSLPPTAADEITAAILSYSAGTLIDPECGFNTTGFDIGEDVSVSRLYTPVNKVVGSYGDSPVTLLTVNGSAAGASVPIAFNELSRWTEGNIVVNIT